MSHDFAIWHSESPLESEDAQAIYTSLNRGEVDARLRPSTNLDDFANALHARWPNPQPGHEDETPWTAPIDASESRVLLCIVSSRLWDVWPTIGKLAEQFELVMYDPQQRHVFLPKRLSQKRTRLRAKNKRQAGT